MKRTSGLLNILLALLTAFILAGCPEPVVPDPPAAPEINVRTGAVPLPSGTGSYGFADVAADGPDGVTGDYTAFTIENALGGPLVISNVLLSSADFDMTNPLTLRLEAGGATTFTVRFDPLAVGARSAQVTILSNDLDESTYTFTVTGTGVTPPAAPGIVINSGAQYANTTAVTLALTAPVVGTGATQMMIADAADFTGGAWEPLAPTRAWSLPAGDGDKTVYAKFADTAGTESAVYSDSITLDTGLPGAPSAPDLDAADDSGLQSDDNLTNVYTGLTFTGTGAEAGHTVRLTSSRTGFVGSATAAADGGWSVNVTLLEGLHTITAVAVDAAGNESPASAGLDVTIDTAPPSVPVILKPITGTNTGANRRPQFMWSAAFGGARYDLQADDTSDFSSVEYDWSSLTGTTYQPVSDMAASSAAPVGTRYYLRLRAMDAAGNISGWSNVGFHRYINVGRFNSDFNGDGYSDIAVGDPYYNSSQGRVSVYYGGTAPHTSPDLTLTGEATSNGFGYRIAASGDYNGDGYSDLLISAPYYDTSRGKGYLHLGGPGMDNVAEFDLTGEATYDNFGNQLSSAGDVNGDGFDDFMIQASGYGDYGRVYFYHGGSTIDTTADLLLTGDAQMVLQKGISSAGDVNGDGLPDIIMGVYRSSPNLEAAMIFFGGIPLDNAPDITLSSELSYSNGSFARVVNCAGDVNGDGYSDVIIGFPYYGYNIYYYGRVYLYLGGANMNSTPDVIITGDYNYAYFGESVSPSGDVNNDGYDDFAIGDYRYSNATGRIRIYFGGASPDNTADLDMAGETTSNYFGYSIAADKDVNGDGHNDLVIGAYYYNSVGRVYLFYGSESFDTSPDVIIDAPAGSVRFGISVAGADSRPHERPARAIQSWPRLPALPFRREQG